MESAEQQARRRLVESKRVVVKLGTRLLADRRGKPNRARIKDIVDSVCQLRDEGKEVVVVSSGAIGMGIDALGLRTRPKSLPELQMAAAVGQTRLVSLYEELFATHDLLVGQVLLTHDLLNHRGRHLNARNTLLTLLRNGIVPVVNENDAVSVDEIRVGDNDSLAALTSVLVDADALVLLTSVSGFKRPDARGQMQKVSYLPEVRSSDMKHAGGAGSAVSVGGMKTKLDAAEMLARTGALTVIADGRKNGILGSIFSGRYVGTVIGGAPSGEVRSSRKRWLAFFHRSSGTIVIDAGAQRALEANGKSLLAVGIRSVRGAFDSGALVNVETADGALIARGLVDYSSADIDKIRGCASKEIASILGRRDYDEVIHRDNLVVLRSDAN